MENFKEQFWVTLWTRGARFQEHLAGPYDTIEEARTEAHRQVKLKPEGSTVAVASSPIPKPSY